MKFGSAGMAQATAAFLAAAFFLGVPSLGAADTLEDQIALCTTCHGEAGMPIEADFPIIWGQEYYYLYVQLKDFAAGRRANDVMTPIASELSKDDMKALAKHFSEQPWPSISFPTDEASVANAEADFVEGQCTQCHLGGFNGNSRVPRLADQQPEYLERTMLDFKNNVRQNAADMSALMRVFEDDEIEDMAEALGAK